MARVVGPVRQGEIVFLSGASDFLGAVAHLLVVEAVQERAGGWSGEAELLAPRALVIDGSNSISPYVVSRIARRRGFDPELVLERVELARAFTAHQLVTLLVQRLASHLAGNPCELVVILGIRDLFEDPDLGASEARQLASHAMERVRLYIRRHHVPCLVTSSWPGKTANAGAMERALSYVASRVVRGLSFDAVAGAGGDWRRALGGQADRGPGVQQSLEEWGAVASPPPDPWKSPPDAPRSPPWAAPAWPSRAAPQP